MPKLPYIARPDQLLCDHLEQAGDLSRLFGEKLNLAQTAKLLGNLHDIGKHSTKFQRYIHSAAGNIKPGEPDYLDPVANKGKIDHSTAGAQWIWQNAPEGKLSEPIAQILATCIASHHGGLIDALSVEGENSFQKRMGRPQEKTHLSECLSSLPNELESLFKSLYLSGKINAELEKVIMQVAKNANGNATSLDFGLGLLTRMCLSCLVDADHSNSAGRIPETSPTWGSLCEKLEAHIRSFDQSKPINQIRSNISEQCLSSAQRSIGTYQLTVPTGGGKTLACLRFALHHAKKHNLDRIFYIIPYTSIIDQNAQVVRDILENDSNSNVILEHHSNLTQNNDTEKNRLLAENWDSPIVFTTLVQFLETLFGSGTRGVRRMHRLANAVIIFDEPQTLPINVIHMFNQSLNMLRQQWRSTVVLCTATQPIFHLVDAQKGAISLSETPDLIQDKNALFEKLRRVDVSNHIKPEKWSITQAESLIHSKIQRDRSVLYIANTKNAAKMIYEAIKNHADLVIHLSTNMCPAHRREKFALLNETLDLQTKKVICISTQLIEAGVDVSFDCVIRSLTGLDSIAQAAGRCNRHAESDKKGEVIVINPDFENLGSLEEMKEAQRCTKRLFREFERTPDAFSNDLIGLKALHRYYQFFYFERSSQMDYPSKKGALLELLASNETAKEEHKRQENGKESPLLLNQSFKTANKAFEAIDSYTESIVVPFGKEGRAIIGDLCAETWDPHEAFKLRKRAQQYSVNVFPGTLLKLHKANAIHETSEESGIYHLNEQFYNNIYGLSLEGDGSLATLEI